MDQNRKIIYADELMAAIREDLTIRGAAFAAIVRHINAATAVDAVPVVHARWEPGAEFNVGDVCSSCYFDSKQKGTKLIRCPHCGAFMDLPNITDTATAALESMGANAHGGGGDA